MWMPTARQKEGNHQQHGKAHPFILMSPHAGAFVTTPEGTITAKAVQELRLCNRPTAATAGHIQGDNQWTDQKMTQSSST
jgi:hypothetical protein